MDYRPGGGDSRDYGATAHAEYHFSDDSFLKGHIFQSITSDDHWRMFDYQDQDGTACTSCSTTRSPIPRALTAARISMVSSTLTR